MESTTVLRRALHREPELSGNESGTGRILKLFLEERKPDMLLTGLGGHGLIAVYRSSEPGRTILLRCETDAVPVDEDLDVPHRSIKPGVAHKCGHDGHMAILAGVADRLHRTPPDSGTVLLLFQPAEETGRGAVSVLADSNFREFEPDMVFALHNLPGFPPGSLIIRNGTFACASRGLVIRLTGKSSHAGEPLKGNSPAPAVAEIIREFETICNHDEGVIVTLIHAVIGEIAFGTSPGNAVVMATLRAPTSESMGIISARAAKAAEQAASRNFLGIAIEWVEEFPATVNSPQASDLVKKSAMELGLKIIEPDRPFPWSEDFGSFTERYSGALFGLGTGVDCPPLHSPGYDYPDSLTGPGIDLLLAIVANVLKNGK